MSYDITKDLEGVCGRRFYTSNDQRMSRIQRCSGCPALRYEQADQDIAPPGYGHHFCHYTDECVDKYYGILTFSPKCPLIQNEREKRRRYPNVIPLQSIASPDE